MWKRMPLRGGNRNNGSNAGPGALNCNNERSNSNTNIGFRPALRSSQMQSLKGGCECTIEKGLYSCLRANIQPPPAASIIENVAGGTSLPKTVNGLWPQIISWDNLLAAYKEAIQRKRSSSQILTFSRDLEENIINIQNELMWKTWTPTPVTEFFVYEPKRRKIGAPRFRDRVVHHAIVRVIEGAFEKRMIRYSCACRRGKGTHFAVKRAENLIRRPSVTHILKGDIAGYFPSINHDILKATLRRTIADPDVLWALDRIIDAESPGVPIGALTSQIFANIYLDPLDHYITDELAQPYVRYMDDFILTGGARKEMIEAQHCINRFVNSRLALTLNPKTSVYPVSHGVDFCGYRIFRTHRLPRKRNVRRARGKLQLLADQVTDAVSLDRYKSTLMSFLGYMKHCRGYRSTSSTLRSAVITTAQGEKQ